MGASAVVGDAREALRELAAAVAETGRQPDPAYALEVEHARQSVGVDPLDRGIRPAPGRTVEPGPADRCHERAGAAGRHHRHGRRWATRRYPEAVGRHARSRMSHRVRQLMHGPRDPGCPRHAPGEAGGRGDRLRGRRDLPDEPQRDRDGRAGRAQGHHRHRGQRRIPGDPTPPAGRGSVGHSGTSSGVATPRIGSRATTCRSTSRPTRRVSALGRGRSRPRPSCGWPSTRPGRMTASPRSWSRSSATRSPPSSGSWWDAAPPETSTDASTRSFAGSTRFAGQDQRFYG